MALLMVVALVWLAGCATGGGGRRRATFQDTRGASAGLSNGGGGAFGFWKKEDAFQRLQESVGLEEEDWHEEEVLESEDARAL